MTTILAIIGAITGVAGLSIQFVSYLSSRPKINFGQSSKPNQSLYVVPSDGTFGILNGYPARILKIRTALFLGHNPR